MTEDSSSHRPTKRILVYSETSRRAGLEFVCVLDTTRIDFLQSTGDRLIGVDDNREVLGIENDRLETDDKFMRHLAQAVRNGLGDRAATCIDPKVQLVKGKTVCLVSCQRSPEPVYLRWKGMEKASDGDLYIRSGPGTV